MVEIRNLCAGYPGREVLHNVSLQAREGSITAVIGPNGCGKSTLLKTLSGVVTASAGSAELDGMSLLQLPKNELARKVSRLSQNRQIPDITVGRLVLHGRFPYLDYPRRYRERDRQAAKQAMEQMGILDLADVPMPRLSGGQQQKAYLAMTLAQDTPLVLLDEPTTYLDISCQRQLLELARQLADRGKHVVMVIHDLSHALEHSDAVVIMEEGKTVIQGTPEEVYCSGALEKIFGIPFQRVQTVRGWHYFSGF